MQVESALFFETVEQIYGRVFRSLRPRQALPQIAVRYRKYANANSRISLHNGSLTVDISDMLQHAPAPIQEALAIVLLSKLFRLQPDKSAIAQYQRYLNRADIRGDLQAMRRERGRKHLRSPRGTVYDLEALFVQLNQRYFDGSLEAPTLGWSIRPSRTTLGHYDPSHHVIVLSRLLDSQDAPEIAVRFVMFHEMLHLKYPAENRAARRCVHTAEFKQAEQTFEDYRRAKDSLAKFISDATGGRARVV